MGANVGKLQIGQSYQLIRFVIRMFIGRKYLSWPPSAASIHQIDDIGEVREAGRGDDGNLVTAVVVGVLEMESHYSCKVTKKHWAHCLTYN